MKKRYEVFTRDHWGNKSSINCVADSHKKAKDIADESNRKFSKHCYYPYRSTELGFDFIEANTLIAGFDIHIIQGIYPSGSGKGYWIYNGKDYDKTSPELLQYHTSFDWLMPVIDRIEKMSVPYKLWTTENDKGIPVMYHCDWYTYSQPRWGNKNLWCGSSKGKTRLEVTYKAVVVFIEWYNENK